MAFCWVFFLFSRKVVVGIFLKREKFEEIEKNERDKEKNRGTRVHESPVVLAVK